MIAAGLFFATLAVYSPVSNHDFVNYDDLNLVVHNPYLTAPATPGALTSHFVRPVMGNWLPVHWISLHLGHAIHGANPAAFLWTNVVIHALASILLFAALLRMTGALWRSAFVAAVFSLHPLHVESVAWVSERKDVLAAFFWMLGLYAYARYVEKADSMSRYAAVMLCFVLGLMSKATLVVFPFVLLLLDDWPLDRLRIHWRARLREKVPMVLASLAVSAITYSAHSAVGNMRVGVEVGRTARVLNAIQSYWLYLIDVVWPSRLAAMYPHPFIGHVPDSRDVMEGIFLAIALLLVTVAAVRIRNSKPYALVGWIWYLVCLVPMIGLVHVGLQARADRYMYLPLVGLSIVVAWGVGELAASHRRLRVAVIVILCTALLAMVVVTRRQLEHWDNSIALFTRIVDVTENNRFGHEKLALLLGQADRNREAAVHFEEALRIDPNRTTSRFGLATMYERLGDESRAIEQLRIGIAAHPRKVRAHGRLGVLLARAGQYAEAEPHLRYAVDRLPNEAEYQRALADVLAARERGGRAKNSAGKATRPEPDPRTLESAR